MHQKKQAISLSPDEFLRDTLRRAERAVARGVEWVRRVVRAAFALPFIIHSAEIPVGPTRERWCTRDPAGICLEEVDLVHRVRVPDASKESEEHQ